MKVALVIVSAVAILLAVALGGVLLMRAIEIRRANAELNRIHKQLQLEHEQLENRYERLRKDANQLRQAP